MKKRLLFALAASLLLSQVTTSAQDPKAGNPIMHSFGAVSAQAMFSTYMATAQLYDLHNTKAYDSKKTIQLANSYKGMAASVKESLSDLVSSGKLNTDDESFANQAIIINDLLGSMAGGLASLAQDPSQENIANYEKNRQKAWKAISKTLGFEE